MTIKEFYRDYYNYDLKTTFFEDFTIADAFGVGAIKDTYNRSFESWKTDVKYITELSMILNHKGWEHYKKNESFSKLYFTLFEECDAWCMDHLKGDELNYYIRTLD